MNDFINDYRGCIKHHQKSKYKNSNKCIQINKISSKRLPSRSNKKYMLIFPDTLGYQANYFSNEEIQFESVLRNAEDALAFELDQLSYNGNTEQIEATHFYCIPNVSKKLIDTYYHLYKYLYPIETSLIIAASNGNDKLVRKYLNKPLIIDIYPRFEINRQSVISTCLLWNNETYYLPSLIRYNYIYDENIICNCSYCYERIIKSALWFACFNGHLNVVQTLIQFGNIDINEYYYSYWDSLSAAIINNHFDIIKYLMEQIKITTYPFRELFMAIRSGNVHLVNYFLARRSYSEKMLYCGCCINPNYELMRPFDCAIQCFNGDLSIIRTLFEHEDNSVLSEDTDQVPLHIAIQYENEQIIKEILHYKYKLNQRDKNNLTPLMLAIKNNNINIINLLTNIFSQQQYIDEIMLLACHYIFITNFDFLNINSESFIYFKQALNLQEPICNTIPYEAYLFQKECQTINELILIKDNPELMYIQALLVYERLLPQRNEIYLLIDQLQQLSFVYFKRHEYNRCLSILLHFHRRCLSCRPYWDDQNEDDVKLFLDLLDNLSEEEQIIYKEKIIQLIESFCTQLDYMNRIVKLCSKIINLMETNLFNNHDKFRVIHSFQKLLHRKNLNQYEHYSNIFVELISPHIDRWGQPSLLTSREKFLKFLIQCGVNVDQLLTENGKRPLHLIANSYCIEDARCLAEILIKAGAHTDCRDHKGLLPEEYTKDIELKEYLHSKRSISLKCQCAHLILSTKINYDLYLSSSLKNFIFMHQGRDIDNHDAE